MLGMHGTVVANYAVDSADLLLAIGVRFDDRVTGKLEQFAARARIVHIDIDPAEISKNKEAHIPVVSDSKPAMQVLLSSSCAAKRIVCLQAALACDQHSCCSFWICVLPGAQEQPLYIVVVWRCSRCSTPTAALRSSKSPRAGTEPTAGDADDEQAAGGAAPARGAPGGLAPGAAGQGAAVPLLVPHPRRRHRPPVGRAGVALLCGCAHCLPCRFDRMRGAFGACLQPRIFLKSAAEVLHATSLLPGCFCCGCAEIPRPAVCR